MAMAPFTEKHFKTVNLRCDESGIAHVVFNRPDSRNALNYEMVQDIHSSLDLLLDEEDIRVIIFSGSGGKAFISGADISELKDRKGEELLKRVNTNLLYKIEHFPCPTIAAINGYALGGGCELAMACDLRVCGEEARLGQPEVGLGIIPGAGGTYRLPRLVGPGIAKELIFTGRIIDCVEALSIGLVNQVAKDDEVYSTAYDLAMKIAKNSPVAVKFAKLSLNQQSEMSAESNMLFESTAQSILFDGEDKNRRMQAFLDRKKKG
jgi:enoyl-CoA hydratase